MSWPLPISFLICQLDTCSLTPLFREKNALSADPDSVLLMVNKKLDLAPETEALQNSFSDQVRKRKQVSSGSVERAHLDLGGEGLVLRSPVSEKGPPAQLVQRFQVFSFFFFFVKLYVNITYIS